MKTLKFVFVITATLIFGLMTSTCTRTSIDDPGMTGYAGYQVILSGTAHPSTMFIPQGTGWVTSRITMRATYNNGAPFPEGRIMLKINEDFGIFENDKDYAFINLNAQGIGWVKYRVNRLERQEIGASQLINIYAVLQADNRLDSEESLIYDYIPIKLITDYEPVPDTLNASTPLVTFFVAGGTSLIDVINVTNPSNPIVYNINLSDTWIVIFGYTGSTPDTLSLTVGNNTGTARTATITLTATDPDVLGSPITITVNQDGT